MSAVLATFLAALVKWMPDLFAWIASTVEDGTLPDAAAIEARIARIPIASKVMDAAADAAARPASGEAFADTPIVTRVPVVIPR